VILAASASGAADSFKAVDARGAVSNSPGSLKPSIISQPISLLNCIRSTNVANRSVARIAPPALFSYRSKPSI
jgi:hypothetical protein